MLNMVCMTFSPECMTSGVIYGAENLASYNDGDYYGKINSMATVSYLSCFYTLFHSNLINLLYSG